MSLAIPPVGWHELDGLQLRLTLWPRTSRPRGQRLVAAVPHGHWKTSTFVAALRTSGLNPIEQAFAKLKALLRNIAARIVARLWDAVGDQLDRFTPQECVNYLANAGYVPLVRG